MREKCHGTVNCLLCSSGEAERHSYLLTSPHPFHPCWDPVEPLVFPDTELPFPPHLSCSWFRSVKQGEHNSKKNILPSHSKLQDEISSHLGFENRILCFVSVSLLITVSWSIPEETKVIRLFITPWVAVGVRAGG